MREYEHHTQETRDDEKRHAARVENCRILEMDIEVLQHTIDKLNATYGFRLALGSTPQCELLLLREGKELARIPQGLTNITGAALMLGLEVMAKLCDPMAANDLERMAPRDERQAPTS